MSGYLLAICDETGVIFFDTLAIFASIYLGGGSLTIGIPLLPEDVRCLGCTITSISGGGGLCCCDDDDDCIC